MEFQTAQAVTKSVLLVQRAGLSVIAPAEDGTKRPKGRWQTSHEHARSRAEVGALSESPRVGLGIVTGAVSHNTIRFEFDDLGTDEQFKIKAGEVSLWSLVERTEVGYRERTPGRRNSCPKRSRCALAPRASRRDQGAKFCFASLNTFFSDWLIGSVDESDGVWSSFGYQAFVEPVERQLRLPECGEGEAA